MTIQQITSLRLGQPELPHPPLSHTIEVCRRVRAGPERISAVAGEPTVLTTSLPGGYLFVMGPMTPSPGRFGTTWNGEGRLRRAGWIPRSVRVAVEFDRWSIDAGEIRVSPASRWFAQWGVRRLDRYFNLAHATADHIHRVLDVQDVVPADADVTEVGRVPALESAA